MREQIKRWIELLAVSGSNTKNQVREEMIEWLKNQKVFSKQKFIDVEGKEWYEMSKKWVDECDGLTEEQMGKLCYATEEAWMVSYENYFKND